LPTAGASGRYLLVSKPETERARKGGSCRSSSSRVERPSRSSLVTRTMTPGARAFMSLASSGRSARAPLIFSGRWGPPARPGGRRALSPGFLNRFWLEPDETYHVGAALVLEAGTLLALVTFVGDASDEDFWRRTFVIQVPSQGSAVLSAAQSGEPTSTRYQIERGSCSKG
jgi:hypothetical protein